ncbi:MAG: hypothetical protein O3B22_17180, partial [Proteobacteria bacterium]|nr:hypothetical protein [Pseudomonadota bacterium]
MTASLSDRWSGRQTDRVNPLCINKMEINKIEQIPLRVVFEFGLGIVVAASGRGADRAARCCRLLGAENKDDPRRMGA